MTTNQSPLELAKFYYTYNSTLRREQVEYSSSDYQSYLLAVRELLYYTEIASTLLTLEDRFGAVEDAIEYYRLPESATEDVEMGGGEVAGFYGLWRRKYILSVLKSLSNSAVVQALQEYYDRMYKVA